MKKEFHMISDTIYSHLGQIIKMAKQEELRARIPFPINLDEDDTLKKVFELRLEQLRVGIELGLWNDAFRTSESIHHLINSQRSQANRMKQILIEFYQFLAVIFQKSEYSLFHAYSLLNLQSIIRIKKNADEEKKKVATEFVLATLSIPLSNRVTNFEKLMLNYIPVGLRELIQEDGQSRTEFFQLSQLLSIKGTPSRKSLIQEIKLKNTHIACGPEIQSLF